MKILESIESTPTNDPLGITVGSFDGVHIGHQSLLKHLRTLVGIQGSLAVITFSNHPTHVLPGATPIQMIYSTSQKLFALEQAGVDLTFLFPFTLDFAAQSYDIFLHHLYKVYPFQFLVLGQGAALGKNREGTPEKIQQLGKELGFEAIYLPKQQIDGKNISSKEIRNLIHQGKFQDAAALLGRPYRLEGQIILDIKNPKKGTLPLEGMCHPKHGEYPVEIINEYNRSSGIAIFNEFAVEIFSSDLPLSKTIEINF